MIPKVIHPIVFTHMGMYDLGRRQNMRKKPVRADFECFEDFGSAERGEIRGIIRRRESSPKGPGKEIN